MLAYYWSFVLFLIFTKAASGQDFFKTIFERQTFKRTPITKAHTLINNEGSLAKKGIRYLFDCENNPVPWDSTLPRVKSCLSAFFIPPPPPPTTTNRRGWRDKSREKWE